MLLTERPLHQFMGLSRLPYAQSAIEFFFPVSPFWDTTRTSAPLQPTASCDKAWHVQHTDGILNCVKNPTCAVKKIIFVAVQCHVHLVRATVRDFAHVRVDILPLLVDGTRRRFTSLEPSRGSGASDTFMHIPDAGLRVASWNIRLLGSTASSQISRERKHRYLQRLIEIVDTRLLARDAWENLVSSGLNRTAYEMSNGRNIYQRQVNAGNSAILFRNCGDAAWSRSCCQNPPKRQTSHC